MFSEQMERWIPHALLNWTQNLNRILWFDLYLILSSAKRYFFVKTISSIKMIYHLLDIFVH